MDISDATFWAELGIENTTFYGGVLDGDGAETAFALEMFSCRNRRRELFPAAVPVISVKISGNCEKTLDNYLTSSCTMESEIRKTNY